MPEDFRDIALQDAALDYVIQKEELALLNDELADALVEAVTYRTMVLVALELLHDEQIQRQRLDCRLRQVAGIDPWRADEAEA